MARKSPHSPKFLADTQERRLKALEGVLAGKTQRQIADEMGYSFQAVSKWIKEAIADITRPKAEELIEIQNQRFDRLLAGVWSDATQGDTWKIDRALAIEDQRARLLGLYKHTELKVIADAKGGLSAETASMVGSFFDKLATLVANETDTEDAGEPEPEDAEGENE